MEDKSKIDEKHISPENLEDANPVDNRFWKADDSDFPSNSTTGSGYSEAEREVHDGHNSDHPTEPTENK